MTALKYTLTTFYLALAHISFGQLGHYLVSTSAGESDVVMGNIANISWSIGEPVAFNTDLTKDTSAHPGFGIAHAMQSYPTSPVVIQCPKITLESSLNILCNSFSTLHLNFTISYSDTLKADSVQWYFSEEKDSAQFSKIAGAQSPTFTPYFPGYYAVQLTFSKLDLECRHIRSSNYHVLNFTSNVNAPTISKSGDVLTSSYDTQMGTPTLQWYAYVTSLGKYLLVAGGTTASLNVRYNADYMMVASYSNGCRLSFVYTVNEYTTALFRAQDTRIDGNTIYIPNEEPSTEPSLTVYPNPATGSFYVKYLSPTAISTKLQIYSDAGVFFKEVEFSEGGIWTKNAKINTDQFSAGLYLVKVSEEGRSLVQKVMVYK